MNLKLGDMVGYKNTKGVVRAISGTDSRVIIRYQNGQSSNWVDETACKVVTKEAVEQSKKGS